MTTKQIYSQPNSPLSPSVISASSKLSVYWSPRSVGLIDLIKSSNSCASLKIGREMCRKISKDIGFVWSLFALAKVRQKSNEEKFSFSLKLTSIACENFSYEDTSKIYPNSGVKHNFQSSCEEKSRDKFLLIVLVIVNKLMNSPNLTRHFGKITEHNFETSWRYMGHAKFWLDRVLTTLVTPLK